MPTPRANSYACSELVQGRRDLVYEGDSHPLGHDWMKDQCQVTYGLNHAAKHNFPLLVKNS